MNPAPGSDEARPATTTERAPSRPGSPKPDTRSLPASPWQAVSGRDLRFARSLIREGVPCLDQEQFKAAELIVARTAGRAAVAHLVQPLIDLDARADQHDRPVDGFHPCRLAGGS